MANSFCDLRQFTRRQSPLRSLQQRVFAMSPYEVCPAEMRDAKAIAEIHAAAARAAYKGIVPDDQLDALAPSTREAKWRQAIEFAEPQVHVAVQGDQVVGFVG